MRCYNKFCIYNENEDCHNPNEQYINNMGACAECIMINVDEKTIKKNKEQKLLNLKRALERISER